MGQQQSKDESLYQQACYGNAEGIKSLCREGAGLEWTDREGKTPLMLACSHPELLHVAKTLIELGANINAYRTGRAGGTPLHHAAKRGLDNTVKLLLSHGANPLLLNDDCQAPLDVARAKRYSNVVRAIESHICLFSGWLREFYGPGLLEVLTPQLVSRNVWVVVLPTGSRDTSKPLKLELAIYSKLQDARPRSVIALWRANLEEPKFHLFDTSVTIVINNIPRGRRRRRARLRHQTCNQTRVRLASANESDRQQLQLFCDACKGIPQASHPPSFLHNSQAPTVPPTASLAAEDLELEMAINASIQSAMAETQMCNNYSSTGASSSTSWNNSVNNGNQNALSEHVTPQKATSSQRKGHEAGPSGHSTHLSQGQVDNIPAIQIHSHAATPSAPPVVHKVIENGPIGYPSVDSSPIDMCCPVIASLPANTVEKRVDGGSSTCVICLDAPIEGACVPCGHMAGCMSCLNEIKAKKWGCPVCRAKINEIIKLYTV